MRNTKSNSIPKGTCYTRILILVIIVIIFSALLLIQQNSTPIKNFNPENKSIDFFGRENHTIPSSKNKSSTINKVLLDGLLTPGFDSASCLSRYESHLYRKSSSRKPSSYLVSKLRNYERLHRRCGPNSRRYKRKLKELATTNSTQECNYVVALPINGLGNRMMSLASTFLYAILTNRVLLVAFEPDMSDLFCEPFLGSTWQLPQGFPHVDRIKDLPTYETLVKRNESTTSMLFVNLQHYERKKYEKFFHCGEGQMILNRVPFLIMSSNQYFAPSLFLVPWFEDQLNQMFPQKDSVFHHLGRYLFSPSNDAWVRITRFYKANLSKADRRVGIQVRVFDPKSTPFKTIMDQILGCTLNNNILPKANASEKSEINIAVLVTSLYKDYKESLAALYKMGPNATREVVQVYQHSHEEVQRFNNGTHHVMALTEMYLLSLCDELVTSGESSFGYVAQGLGGLQPWILHKTLQDSPCVKALSMDPCFPFSPKYDCHTRNRVKHISLLYPHIRKCEDFGTGMKMVFQP